jgi:hypothetical protein
VSPPEGPNLLQSITPSTASNVGSEGQNECTPYAASRVFYGLLSMGCARGHVRHIDARVGRYGRISIFAMFINRLSCVNQTPLGVTLTQAR